MAFVHVDNIYCMHTRRYALWRRCTENYLSASTMLRLSSCEITLARKYRLCFLLFFLRCGREDFQLHPGAAASTKAGGGEAAGEAREGERGGWEGGGGEEGRQ